ncbi:MAG: M48 family metalloprotease [Candidatus Poribacteria bacterium]
MLPISAIVLTVGLIFLFFWTPSSKGLSIEQSYFIAILSILLTILPAVVVFIAGKIISKRHRDSYINPFEMSILGFIASILSISFFVVQIYWLQLPVYLLKSPFPKFTNIKTFLLITFLVISFMLCRLAIFLIRKKSDITLTAKNYFLPDIKLMFIPSLPFSISLLISDIIDMMPLKIRIFFVTHSYIYLVIIMGIAIFMFIKSSFFIRHIWSARSLEKGEIRDRIISLAKRNNIRFGDILVWNMGGRQIANAGMAGLLPRSRAIFVTDFLLSNFTLDEIETIIAHEFGHIKMGHIPAYIILSFAYLSFSGMLFSFVLPEINYVSSNETVTALLSGIFTVLIFFTYFIIIFRFISRIFERQADVYAVKITKKPSSFKDALMKVAYINQVMMRNPRIFKIFATHPSMSERLELVDKVVNDQNIVKNFNRIFFDFKRSFLLLLIVITALWFTSKDLIFPPSELHYEIGRQYAIEGMIDQAIAEFNKAYDSNPKSDQAIFALGLLYMEKGAISEAKEKFQKVLEINPKNTMAANKLNQIIEMEKNKQGG